MKKRVVLFVIIFWGANLYSQSPCETGIIANDIFTDGNVLHYYNLFGQSFEIPECVTHIQGIEIDLVGTYYDGMMRLWNGTPCTGANPQPLAEAHIGSANGTIGVINSYERFDFLEPGSPGVEIPGPGTYTITFSMNSVLEGLHYDDYGYYAEGEFYFFELGDWRPYSGDLFFKLYVTTNTTEVEREEFPTKFELYQNYPNPFNPTTTIKYAIPSLGGVETQNLASLRIYNILGEEIETLVNKRQAPGNYSVQFNASNLPSGVYFYKLQCGNFVSTKKMIFLK